MSLYSIWILFLVFSSSANSKINERWSFKLSQYFTHTPLKEMYLFVSDLHGYNQKLDDTLYEIGQRSRPEIVFFIGDIVGTDLLDQLQKLFYNGIFNPIKKLLGQNDKPSDSEILNFSATEGVTILDGCKNMCNFLASLDPKYHHPTSYAKFAMTLSGYVHFGHFVGNLTPSIRKTLQKDMESNAEKDIRIMADFVEHGSMVVVVEGNWDARTPLDFYPNGEVIPPQRRIFRFKKFLLEKSPKVLYFDQSGIIETDTCIFVIWPFDSAVTSTQIPKIGDNEQNKKVVLVSHAQISWEAIKGDIPMTNEGKKIENNMPTVASDLKANAVVHGHLHDKIANNFSGYIFEGTFVHYLPKDTCRFIDF